MILTLYLIIAWGITLSFLLIPKKLTFIDCLILWFVNSMVIVCSMTILTLNFEWLHYSLDKQLALTFLLSRSFIHPMLLLIYAMLVSQVRSVYGKMVAFIGILLAMLLLEVSLVQFGVIIFIKFNYFFTSILYVVFLFISYLLTKILHRGGSYEDYRL